LGRRGVTVGAGVLALTVGAGVLALTVGAGVLALVLVLDVELTLATFPDASSMSGPPAAA